MGLVEGRMTEDSSLSVATRGFILQRLSALGLVPFMVGFFCLPILKSFTFDEVVRLLGHPLSVGTVWIVTGVVLLHGYLGVMCIIEDYTRGWLRFTLWVLVWVLLLVVLVVVVVCELYLMMRGVV